MTRQPSAEERAYLESLVTTAPVLADRAVYSSTVSAGWVAVNGYDRPWDPRRAQLTDAGLAMLCRTDDAQPTWHVLRARAIDATQTALDALAELGAWGRSDWREGTAPEGGARLFSRIHIQAAACVALIEQLQRDMWEAGRADPP